MESSIELEQKENFNFQDNSSNALIVLEDNQEKGNSTNVQKDKMYIQIPVEEGKEAYDNIIESTNSYLSLKTLFDYLDDIDKKISKPLQTYTPNFLIECIFFIFAKLFNTEEVIAYLLICFLYSYVIEKNIYLFYIYFFHVIAGLILTLSLKKIIGRNRPTLTVKRFFHNVRNKETNKSMPSGDSLQAGNFAVMMILYCNSTLKYFALLLIPGVVCGRVYFNCHYFFDCLIGVLLGICSSIGSYLAINNINYYLSINF